MKKPRYKKNSKGEYIDIYKKDPYFIYHYKPSRNFIIFKEVNPISYLVSENNQEIKKLIKERYDYLRQNEWSDNNIFNNIENYEKDIFDSGAYLRDKERWPLGTYLKNNSTKLDIFKKYVKERIKYSDEYFEKL